MAGLGRAGTRIAIALVTVLSIAVISWLVSPAFAQGSGRSTQVNGRSVQLDVKAPGATAASPGTVVVGTPLSTSAAIQPVSITPFEMSYGKHKRQTYLAYLPAVKTSTLAVVVIHGGGWVAGSAEDTVQYNQRLYTEGIASFSIDYRYASDAPWPAQRGDLAAAVANIRGNAAKWGFSPGSIAVMGISAGGHMALDMASGAGQKSTCGAVSYSGPTSIKLLLADARLGKKQLGLAKSARRLAPTAAARKSATLPHSPATGDAPALLFAAQYDWVSNANTSRYARAYAGVALDVRAMILPGETRHASGYALNDPQVWTTSIDFLREHCGG